MRTSDGLTKGLRTYQVAFSLISLTIILVAVTAATVYLIVLHAKRGPLTIEADAAPAESNATD